MGLISWLHYNRHAPDVHTGSLEREAPEMHTPKIPQGGVWGVGSDKLECQPWLPRKSLGDSKGITDGKSFSTLPRALYISYKNPILFRRVLAYCDDMAYIATFNPKFCKGVLKFHV